MTDRQKHTCNKPCCTEPAPEDGVWTRRDLTHLTTEEQLALLESEETAMPVTRLPGDE